jgi:hypothetical protein
VGLDFPDILIVQQNVMHGEYPDAFQASGRLAGTEFAASPPNQ